MKFYKEEVPVTLICSDCNGKDKTCIWAFINHIFDNLIKISDDDKDVKVIWSDGPKSEFKNRFMVKVCLYLS